MPESSVPVAPAWQDSPQRILGVVMAAVVAAPVQVVLVIDKVGAEVLDKEIEG